MQEKQSRGCSLRSPCPRGWRHLECYRREEEKQQLLKWVLEVEATRWRRQRELTGIVPGCWSKGLEASVLTEFQELVSRGVG